MNLQTIHDRLLEHYGPQGWWPADDTFEMMMGAILTQNTNWTNVELAIANLRAAGLLDAGAIATCDEVILARAIRPSGYFNQKGKKLKVLAEFYLEHGGAAGIDSLPDTRGALMSLHGIGPETADSILLYALHRPVFVIDAYTRRLFGRLGITPPDASYEVLQHYVQARLPADVGLFNEYHALIVMHAKQHCRNRPACSGCPLEEDCTYARRHGHGNIPPTPLTV